MVTSFEVNVESMIVWKDVYTWRFWRLTHFLVDCLDSLEFLIHFGDDGARLLRDLLRLWS